MMAGSNQPNPTENSGMFFIRSEKNGILIPAVFIPSIKENGKTNSIPHFMALAV